MRLNPFLYRFLHWSSRREQFLGSFPNLYRFGDQEIFINSSFRLIFNFRHLDRLRKNLLDKKFFFENEILEWKNVLLKNRLINMSLSLNKLENDLWLRLVQFKCQPNFLQQIRSNERNHFIASNEQFNRRVNSLFLQTLNNFIAGETCRYT